MLSCGRGSLSRGCVLHHSRGLCRLCGLLSQMRQRPFLNRRMSETRLSKMRHRISTAILRLSRCGRRCSMFGFGGRVRCGGGWRRRLWCDDCRSLPQTEALPPFVTGKAGHGAKGAEPTTRGAPFRLRRMPVCAGVGAMVRGALPFGPVTWPAPRMKEGLRELAGLVDM